MNDYAQWTRAELIARLKALDGAAATARHGSAEPGIEAPLREIQEIKAALDATGKPCQYVAIRTDITERRRLEAEILEISDREQRRIGRDLHDGLGQQLTALELLNQALVGRLHTEAPALVKPAKAIAKQIREIVTQTRLLSRGLSPVSLETEGLMHALQALAAGADALAGIECRFDCPAPVLLPEAATATHLYRIAQEAVNNALKHSRAKRLRLALAGRTDRWVLTIEDNGRGLPSTPAPGSGLGLRIMNYRAQLIGATLQVESSPRKGVRVICTLRRNS